MLTIIGKKQHCAFDTGGLNIQKLFIKKKTAPHAGRYPVSGFLKKTKSQDCLGSAFISFLNKDFVIPMR